jgi:hypothetical protein
MRWFAAYFDGRTALLDALAYVKDARAGRATAALEVSRCGVGAHVWTFFTSPVSAVAARRVGTGLLREALAIRGHMSLTSHDRLFPSPDVLPATGGVGNLIAARAACVIRTFADRFLPAGPTNRTRRGLRFAVDSAAGQRVHVNGRQVNSQPVDLIASLVSILLA